MFWEERENSRDPIQLLYLNLSGRSEEHHRPHRQGYTGLPPEIRTRNLHFYRRIYVARRNVMFIFM
jgi:hypothetical protein